MPSWRLTLNLARVEAELEGGAERGLLLAGEHVGQVADTRVPIEYGDLERSRRVTTDGRTVAISYNTPYAARQHEELDWQHNAGRQAKYLESAVVDEADTVARILADEMRLR